jgi:nitrate reductase gamma subunit
MAALDSATLARTAMPDVFTGLLLVAMILLGLACGAMYFTNTDHSATDRSEGGPIALVDEQ